MVSTRLSSATTRRRNLKTIFDAAAARHAATPAIPAAVELPAANTAAATFVAAAVRILIRTRFDEKSAKSVAKKWFGSKDERLHGNEKAVATIFTRMVTDLHESFVAKDPLLPSWTSTNAALVAARRKNTLDNDDVKGLFIDALDREFYLPVTSRLLLHARPRPASGRGLADRPAMGPRIDAIRGPRAGGYSAGRPKQSFNSAVARFGDPPGQDSSDDDLMDILLALRKEMRVLSEKVNGKGFNPRAEKPPVGPRKGPRFMHRLAASPLVPAGGNWTLRSKLVAFHRDSAQTIPLCQHSSCAAEKAKHWHRDCPRGGPRAEKAGAGAHSFAVSGVESDFYYAITFQHAIDTNDRDRLDDALCFLAGGKPEIIEDFVFHRLLLCQRHR
ncbi:hypothetical protein CYMTET_51257 [Cymbomonas tetramitiformis]|uniref:Uncharacterized protein n=1 Tax=Cymbomonas tetramitiformis TaxID=36881 RepID=A0AAE0BMM4_9CHLO|nr:hypothetical protein CYMTET_51257 [Cymbomonas tetramitiformis]